MTKTELMNIISQRIKEMIQYAGTITQDQLLVGIGVDSMKALEIIVDLENRFNILIEDDELLLENFATVEKIADLIEGKISKVS
nr:acyl carrier protein [Paenibacillus xylanexedens]